MHPIDNQLRILLAQPRAVQAIKAHARANPERDPIRRVQQAVGSIAPHLADRAAQHAAAAKVAEDDKNKVSKSSVNYRPGSVAEHCGNCSMYRNPHTCTHVRGVIDPSATCKDWEAQGGSAGRSGTGVAGAVQGGSNPSAPATFKAHRSILQHARQAPDGHHYVPDPNRPGKYARVVGSVDGTQHEPAMISQGSPSPGSNMREIEMIRHGSTDLNSDDTSVDRIRGHEDVPLNQEGKNEAAATGKELATRADEKPDVLVSSDLCRAKLTAQIISDITKIPVSWVTEHFRPWDAGQLTGQPSKYAVPIMAKYAEQRPDEPIPGGESFHTFLGRFFIGLDAALEKHPNQRVAIVSHHRDERTLHAWKAKGFPTDGSIDIPTFNQKGEKTGVSQKMQIPVDRLRAVAQRYQAQAQAQPTAQRQVADDQPGQE